MGMTEHQYWEESPQLAAAYRDAYKLRREAENEMAWVQGLYVYDALAVCLSNAFSKSGARKQNYIERPIDIYPPSEEEKKRREREEYKKMEDAMKAMIARQRQEKKSKGD